MHHSSHTDDVEFQLPEDLSPFLKDKPFENDLPFGHLICTAIVLGV
jgi:hypothetical protein